MKKPLWSKNEEISLIKDIRNKKTLEELSLKYDRTLSALELRLQKIVHDNINAGKSFETLSNIIGLPTEKLKQYYYEYCGHIDKKQRDKKTQNPQKKIENPEIKHDLNECTTLSGGSKDFPVDNGAKQCNAYEKLEKENKLLQLLLDNIDLKKKIKHHIDQGVLDMSVVDFLKKN